MIDTFAILTTTIAVLYILVRAAAFDRSLPWFEKDDAQSAKAAAERDRFGS